MNGSLILHTMGRILLPLSLVFSLYLLWRGHNEPGGGFVGGLIAAAGFTVYAIPRGAGALANCLRIPPQTLAGIGVFLALLSGVPALLEGTPYLTHSWGTLPLGIGIGTTLLFDLGVYCVVAGAILTFLQEYLEG